VLSIPERSILLPGATLTFSKQTFTGVPDDASFVLIDRAHMMVAARPKGDLEEKTAPAEDAPLIEEPATTAASAGPTPEAAPASETTSAEVAESHQEDPSVAGEPAETYVLGEQQAAAGHSGTNATWPYAALIGLVGIGVLALYLRKPRDNLAESGRVVSNEHRE
jgi:hypothetical protein